MSVHIIRVSREISDSGPRERSQLGNYFCKDVDTMEAGHWEPNTDIYESEDEVIIRLELAGVEKDDLAVKVKDAKLHISGYRPRFQSAKEYYYHQVELHCGEFRKTIRLPEAIAHNEITASFQEGILCITISKKDQSIEIPIQIHADMNSER